MIEDFISYTRKLIESDLIQRSNLEDLSETEIELFQQQIGFALPAAYLEFLKFCGKAGCFEITRWECKIKFLESVKNEVLQITTEWIPKTNITEFLCSGFFFAFDTHGGFAFFDPKDSSQDPIVYEWYDSEPANLRIKKPFSIYILETAILTQNALAENRKIWAKSRRHSK